MKDAIFYAIGKKQNGPVTLAALRDLAAKGEFKRSDRLWREGMAQWQPASSIPEIFESFEGFNSPPLPPDKPDAPRTKPVSGGIPNPVFQDSRAESSSTPETDESNVDSGSQPTTSIPRVFEQVQPDPTMPSVEPAKPASTSPARLEIAVVWGLVVFVVTLVLIFVLPSERRKQTSQAPAAVHPSPDQLESASAHVDSTPQPPGIASPSNTARLHVECATADVQVQIDDSPDSIPNQTGYELAANQPIKVVLWRKGYSSLVTNVTLLPGENRKIGPFTLQPILGKVVVTSSPSGAAVDLNGDHDPKRLTPCTIELPCEVDLKVELHMEGYDPVPARSARVHADSPLVGVDFGELPHSEVLWVSFSPPEAQARLDGIPITALVGGVFNKTGDLAGKHVLQLELSGFERQEIPVEIRVGQKDAFVRASLLPTQNSQAPPPNAITADVVTGNSNHLPAPKGHWVMTDAGWYWQSDAPPPQRTVEDPVVVNALQGWLVEVQQMERNPRMRSKQLLREERGKVDRYAAAHGAPYPAGSRCGTMLNQIHAALERMQK